MTRNLAVPLFAIAVAAPLALTGCNTVQGIGEDIAATGRAVENVATYNARPVITTGSVTTSTAGVTGTTINR